MFFWIPALLLILVFLLAPHSAGGGQTTPGEPRYDPATTTAFEGVVTETHEVPRGNPMRGLHLTVDAGKETLDVYLAPAEFMKSFDFTFAKGDRVSVVGSRVKQATTVVILAREVRRQSQTVYLRDNSGNPYWPQGS